MTAPDLAYVALATRDVATTSAFLGKHLHLPQHAVATPSGTRCPAFAVGRTALVVCDAGDAFLSRSRTGIDHIALACANPQDAVARLRLATGKEAAAGLDGATQIAIDASGTCGVDVRLTTPLGLPPAAGDPIERLDHIGIASADNRMAVEIFVTRLGCALESRQTDVEISQPIESFTSDKYGVVYHARAPETIGGLRVSFVTVGDCELEFLQDFDPVTQFEIRHGAPGNTRQDRSAIARFITKHGPGLHHIAFKCRDIDALLSRLAQSNHRMIDVAGRPGSRRSRIGFVHPAALGGILIHFVERADVE